MGRRWPLIVPRPSGPNSISPALKISKSGHFSFDGYGQRGASGDKTRDVKVNLTGKFVSSTRAQLSFQIAYGKCGTQQLTVRWAP